MTQVFNRGHPRSKKGSHKTPPKPPFRPMKSKPLPVIREGALDASKLPSVQEEFVATVKPVVKYDDPVLEERESKAREVQHTVAPICNKGAYQLITGDDIKTAGRKV